MKSQHQLFIAFLLTAITTIIYTFGESNNKERSVKWSLREHVDENKTIYWSSTAENQIGLSCSSTSVEYGTPFTFEIALKSKNSSLPPLSRPLYHPSATKLCNIVELAFRICIRGNDGNEIHLHTPYPLDKKRIYSLPDRMILLDDNKNLWGTLETIDKSDKLRAYLAPSLEEWSGSVWVEYLPYGYGKKVSNKLDIFKSPEIKVTYGQKDKSTGKK